MRIAELVFKLSYLSGFVAIQRVGATVPCWISRGVKFEEFLQWMQWTKRTKNQETPSERMERPPLNTCFPVKFKLGQDASKLWDHRSSLHHWSRFRYISNLFQPLFRCLKAASIETFWTLSKVDNAISCFQNMFRIARHDCNSVFSHIHLPESNFLVVEG